MTRHVRVAARRVQAKCSGTPGTKGNTMKVLNFGSLNVDYVYDVDHIVRPGETIASGQRNIFSGGKGLNQSVAMAKAGVDVYHAGIIGSDGEILMQTLEKYGISGEFIAKMDIPGGHTVIQVDKNGQNSIVVYGGTNMMLTEGYITGVLDHFEKGDMIVLQNETNHIGFIMQEAHGRGMQIVFNPSPCDESIGRLPLRLVDYLVINETEGEEISGTPDRDGIIETLAGKYRGMKIVLTLGGDGSCYYDGSRTWVQPALKVRAVDTTAAGDTYLGYFICGLLEGRPPQQVLELAARAAAIAVSRKGASPSIPFAHELA